MHDSIKVLESEWSPERELNPRPTAYKAVALAAEPPGLYPHPSRYVRSFKNLVPGTSLNS